MVKIEQTKIPDVHLIETDVFKDSRGCFFESYNLNVFNKLIGSDISFVQDNVSVSNRNVLRGLHYQLESPQGKLVRVVKGSVFDVAVDIRKSSPTFGMWVSEVLSDTNNRALWIPEGFAHGFLALSDTTIFMYKTTNFYEPGDEYCIAWNDPDLSIPWPFSDEPIVSSKDMKGLSLKEAKLFL